MAISEIPTQTKSANRTTAEAFWAGVLALDDLALSLERLRETAFALSTSEAFEENAQHAFYSIGELVDALRDRTKKQEDELTELSARHR